MKNYSNQIKKSLSEYDNFSSVIPADFLTKPPFVFDFSEKNRELAAIDLKNAQEFESYVENTLRVSNCKFGAGGYGENRIIYRRSTHYEEEGPRSIHLAVDLWLPAGTPVFSPLLAVLHSFKDNNNFGDYGPTIILEHDVNEIKFYTLYGHLSRSSLENLQIGMHIEKDQEIGSLGIYEENGQWPPHLHFQIISDLLGNRGDFPGVASESEKEFYLNLCPDPNLILRIKELGK